MGGDIVGAKPSVYFTEYQGVRVSGHLIMCTCKSMEMAFQTEQSVRIIVDGCISGMSVRR